MPRSLAGPSPYTPPPPVTKKKWDRGGGVMYLWGILLRADKKIDPQTGENRRIRFKEN